MPTNAPLQAHADKLYVTLMIIFGAMCMSVVMFLLLAVFVGPDPATLAENRIMIIALTAVGTSTALVSIFIRQKLAAKAVEQQRPEFLFSAHIIAFALCEAAALCGLVLRFTTRDSYFYLLFVIAIICLALNRPRRDDIVNASSGKRI